MWQEGRRGLRDRLSRLRRRVSGEEGDDEDEMDSFFRMGVPRVSESDE
jgi:hypothetical protein